MSYILIVDDDTDMAQIIADMVTLLDRKTRIVNGPRAAMEMLWRRRPDMILLDLNMPGVNGMEVCRYIKRDPAGADMPVVIVTADDSPQTQEEARKAGATDYLVKPVDIDQLEKVLAKIPQSTPAKVEPTKPGSPKADPPSTLSLKGPAAKSEPAKPEPATKPKKD